MDDQARTSIDLASLARIAVLAVAHVDGLEPDPVDPARVEADDTGGLRVVLRVRGTWGTPLPPAAGRLRREVVRVTRAMTGLHVRCVDVEVTGLLAPHDPDPDPDLGRGRALAPAGPTTARIR